MFLVRNEVGGGDWWIVVQNETWAQRVQVEVVDLMIGTNIDGVFMDMQGASVARDSAMDIEEGD